MATRQVAIGKDQAHHIATTKPLDEIVRDLEEVLSRRLTAVMAGVKDGKTVARWAGGDVSGIRGADTEVRLRTAAQILYLLLQSSDSPQVAKAWFIGMNPQLGDISPAEAIREKRFTDALSAARAFVVGG